MTQQGMPNPIELYEGAVGYMRPIIAGVTPKQLSNPTPCTDWNVQSLLNHNIKVAQILHSILTGTGHVDAYAVSEPLPHEGAVGAFDVGTTRVLEEIKAPGVLEKLLDTPFGQMLGGAFLMGMFTDVLIHKWDLAVATNQDTSMDSSMADVCYKFLEPMMEGGRKAGFFGSPVVVPANASDRDKLLGLTGRRPST